MAKFSPNDVAEIAERLVQAKARNCPAHFLTGAGCSISAGIPSAKSLIDEIHKKYPVRYSKLDAKHPNPYGACMALLSTNERRDLIHPHLAKAQINWGAIALAQLIAEGFVERVLTLNFDLVLENACGLLGLQPAVYDFGVAPANDPAMVVSPAIVHLHGQSYGLVRLNTDSETETHRLKLEPILIDSLRRAPLIVIGYSGSADGISRTLLDGFEGRDALYWAGYAEEPGDGLRDFLQKQQFQYLGGADFDLFMIELAQSLGCWPPHLFSDPSGHLLKGVKQLVAYPQANKQTVDILAILKRKLESWQKVSEAEQRTTSLQELYMKAEYEEAAKLFSSWGDQALLSDEVREMAYWSYIGWGGRLWDQFMEHPAKETLPLLAEADAKYEAAFRIKADLPDALYNLGIVNLQQARFANDKAASELRQKAAARFDAASRIKPDHVDAISGAGDAFYAQATKTLDKQTANDLLAKAAERYQAAIKIDPNNSSGLTGWGGVLVEQAKRTSGKDANHLLQMASEKLHAVDEAYPPRKMNLGQLAAVLGDEAQCRSYLEEAEKEGTLVSSDLIEDDDSLDNLASVRDKPWFKELVARIKAKGH